ncbi:hypothetical protein TNCV_3888151 [Trichonephila clavipes]|nr:hypothetical protein TNCV_3888151 [Trichonephila clavipes]
MRWAGRIVRISVERTALKICNATPTNKRQKGRPERKWNDDVDEDFAILKGQNEKKPSWEGSGPQRAVMPMLLLMVKNAIYSQMRSLNIK